MGALALAIEAAVLVLAVICAPRVERRLVAQERVEACVALARHLVGDLLLPVLDPKVRGDEGLRGEN